MFERKHYPGYDAYSLLSLIPYDDGTGDSHICKLTLLVAWHTVGPDQDKKIIELPGQYRLDPKYQVDRMKDSLIID